MTETVELDRTQKAAVAHGDGPALVLAGPGSGKTRVVVERAVRLIDDGVARPEQLLVLTFSRKAASDLRQRLAERLRRSYASFPVTTFHSFCFSLLQRHLDVSPRIALPAERHRLASDALEAEGWLGLPRSGALISEALAFCELSDDYLGSPDHALARVRDRYRASLAELGALDYGGLQREAERLLREDPELQARYAAEEADWIARQVAALRLDGVALGQVAILARSLKEIGPRLAYALRVHGIPFHAPLASPTHPTVDALVGLIELALPDRWQPEHEETALRTLASPLFGADRLELRPHKREQRTLYGSLRDGGAFEHFFQALAIVKRQKNAGAAVYALWQRLDYFRDLETRCRHDPSQEDVEELAVVTALSDAANDFDGPLADFPRAFREGELDQDDWLAGGALPEDAVALLTIHQAKGLEWDAVFVCDLVEGRFPALARSEHTLFDRADFASRQLTEPERARRALEEERRLFYVAITRARTRLFLSATEEAREEAGRSLSRFFLEARELLERPSGSERLICGADAEAALRRSGGGSPGWRERAETVNANTMLPDGRLRTSATALSPYEECPLQFYYGTLLDLVRASGDSLVFGSIVHDVLEAFHDPEPAEPLTSRGRAARSAVIQPNRNEVAVVEAELRAQVRLAEQLDLVGRIPALSRLDSLKASPR